MWARRVNLNESTHHYCIGILAVEVWPYSVLDLSKLFCYLHEKKVIKLNYMPGLDNKIAFQII
jgi:hypothetical protein